MSNNVDVKIVILGQEYCGKTSLIQRFVNNKIVLPATVPMKKSDSRKSVELDSQKYQNTIGAAYSAKRIFINGRRLNFGIWDTAGSERYEAISKLYYRNSRAAILCYDPSDTKSYEKLIFWIQELRKHQADTRLYICATKIDLIQNGTKQRTVESGQIQLLANEYGAQIFETSSVSGEKVRELFYCVAKDYLNDTSFSIFNWGRQRKSTIYLPVSPNQQQQQRSNRSCCNVS